MNVTTIITINNNNNIQLLPRNNPYIEEKKLKNYFIPSAFKHNIPCNNSKFESNLLQIYPRRRGGLYYIITANIDEPKCITRCYTLSAFTHEMTRTVTVNGPRSFIKQKLRYHYSSTQLQFIIQKRSNVLGNYLISTNIIRKMENVPTFNKGREKENTVSGY